MEVIDCNDTFFITFHREITRAPVGAKNDAIQSIPLFDDKSGDELNKQVNKTQEIIRDFKTEKSSKIASSVLINSL